MFNFFKKKKKPSQHEHEYDLTYDNVAIPEVHTHKAYCDEDNVDGDSPISYDNVAIPEVHIRKKK